MTAYEEVLDPLHYLTRFLDGLKAPVRLMVALQKPRDLDAAYELALLHEELGEVNSQPPAGLTHRAQPLPLPPPPTRSRQLDEHKIHDTPKTAPMEDKWNALRSYRKAKGLCFVCGERWSKDHQCRQSEQLHIVQELIEQLQPDFSLSSSEEETEQPSQLMSLSAAAVGKATSATTFQLLLEIQGKKFLFLVDSGSTHTFLDSSYVHQLQQGQSIPTVKVQVAGGTVINCQHQLSHCLWTSNGHQFFSDFRLLLLGTYDGILGLDWLAAHSPMQMDWA